MHFVLELTIKLGSNTAKNGFSNEDDIVNKFNTWKKDEDSQLWLEIMGYKLQNIDHVEAIKLHGYKTDVQVKITIYFKEAIAAENISIKLVSNETGFNQVDKRWVKSYIEMWNIPENVAELLKQFTGEDTYNGEMMTLRDSRRVFLDELYSEDQKIIVNFFTKNKFLIVSDILKGRGIFSAGWMLVAQKSVNNSRWILKSINEVMNYFGDGEVYITNKGSLRIGVITMQRKGGDGGRPTANMLQFKINPAELFNIQ